MSNLVERLRADELPLDRQYVREARIILRGILNEAAARIAELEARNAALVEWLDRNADHAVRCAHPLQCTCGLSAILSTEGQSRGNLGGNHPCP